MVGTYLGRVNFTPQGLVRAAKSVFQISLANEADRIVDRKRLFRAQSQRFLGDQLRR